ncbi:hypothetical protein TWF281_007047 [Arthrobotrys megalospora]
MTTPTSYPSEIETSISSGQTYHLKEHMVCNYTNDYVHIDLGIIDLSPMSGPDFVRITLLERNKLAELEITLERFYGYLKVNQQNNQGMWKQEEKYNLRDFFVHGERGVIKIWAKDKPDGSHKVYVVAAPEREITTGIRSYLRTHWVRFEKSATPTIMEATAIILTHWAPGEEPFGQNTKLVCQGQCR